MPNPVVHFDIGCPDLAKSRAFFENVFGWKSSDYGPLSARLDVDDPMGISGYTTSLGHEPHTYVMIYIEVNDIPATLALIESHGGQTVIPEVSIPTGSFAWFQDPHGNQLALWNPAHPT